MNVFVIEYWDCTNYYEENVYQREVASSLEVAVARLKAKGYAKIEDDELKSITFEDVLQYWGRELYDSPEEGMGYDIQVLIFEREVLTGG